MIDQVRKVFLLLGVLVLFALPPAIANDHLNGVWSGLAVGWTTDYFNSEPLQNTWKRVRLEVSPVMRVGETSWLLPQIDWATNNGLVRVTGALYTHVYTYKSTSFYAGGAISPLQVVTDGQVKINSQSSIALDVGATWHFTKGVLFGVALRQEVSGQIGSTIPEIQSPANVTTLKVGLIGIL